MNVLFNVLITIVVTMFVVKLQGQTDIRYNSLSVSASLGYGKVLYYPDYTPTYILAADDEAVKYSLSWCFKVDKHFFLNDLFDFSMGLSHMTITERTRNTAKPSWFIFEDEGLSQGFFHLIPSITLKFPNEVFKINLGLRVGTANFIGNDARESSHSLGSLHADFCLENGMSLLLSPRILLNGSMILGLTKYDYYGDDPDYVTFYKYHTFQVGLSYHLHGED